MQSTRLLRRTVLAATLAGIAAATTAAGPALADDPAGSLSGIVRDTRGTAVTDASVSVYLDSVFDPVQERPVDDNGRFTLTGLKPGSYKVVIGMGGWSEWAPGRVTSREQATSYQVTANNTTVANSVVTAAGIIAGRVLGADGRPAANAAVNITNVDTIVPFAGTTGPDGRFRVRVQPNATFVVGVAVGPVSQYIPRTFAFADATRFFVRSGRTVRVPDERAIAASGITGRVTGAAGAPAGGVNVTFVNADTINESETTTAADGSYDFTGLLEPGRYKVQFSVGGRSQYAHQKPDFMSADAVTLAPGQTAVVDDQLLWVPAPQN